MQYLIILRPRRTETKTTLKSLADFKSNKYSQSGEDGIINEIFSRLNKALLVENWVVEFGAWDGIYLSNTCRLIKEDGFKAVLIEGDPKKVSALNHNFPDDNVVKICKFVNFDGVDTLDQILRTTTIPKNFFFLSIDIDGADYYILESLTDYQPLLIGIEFNHTIPNDVEFVQAKSFDVKHGSSAKSLISLAETKGYGLVAATNVNLFFVREDLKKFVIESPVTLEELYPEGNNPTYVFVGYDGTILSNKDCIDFVWHDLTVKFSNLQPMPRVLRVFPGDYGVFRRMILLFIRLKYSPKSFAQKILKVLKKIKRN